MDPWVGESLGAWVGGWVCVGGHVGGSLGDENDPESSWSLTSEWSSPTGRSNHSFLMHRQHQTQVSTPSTKHQVSTPSTKCQHQAPNTKCQHQTQSTKCQVSTPSTISSSWPNCFYQFCSCLVITELVEISQGSKTSLEVVTCTLEVITCTLICSWTLGFFLLQSSVKSWTD